jgi:tRNA(Ile)-lysidine synthetase-like protein
MNHLSEVYQFVENQFQLWKNSEVFIEKQIITIIKPPIENFYLISRLLTELQFHPATILALKSNYNQSGKRFQNKLHSRELLMDRKLIFIKSSFPEEKQIIELSTDTGNLQTAYGQIKWQSLAYNNTLQNISFALNECYLDKGALKFPLQFRNWKNGDVIQPLGMNGHSKKIQDLFSDKKVPLFDKEKILLLFSENICLWIPGMIRSNHHLLNQETKSYVHIIWTPDL